MAENDKKFITQLNIKNFKGFTDLQLKECSNFNLLIGKNNIGKTSILEAIAFSLGLEPTDFFRSFLMETRKSGIGDIEQYQDFFYQFNTVKPITIAFHCQNHAVSKPRIGHILEYQIQYVDNSRIQQPDRLKIACEVRDQKQGARKINWCDWEILIKEIDKNRIPPAQNLLESFLQNAMVEQNREIIPDWKSGIERYHQIKQQYEPRVCFVPNNDRLSKQETGLIQDRKICQKVLGFIRQIDPHIDEIRDANNTLNIYYHEFDKPFSLNAMGTGFIKILNLYLRILCNGVDVILFDEITDGLHPDTIKILLELIIPELTKRNIQLFATTHSFDILQEIAKYEGNDKQNILVHFLYEEENKIETHYYSQENVAQLKGFADLRRG